MKFNMENDRQFLESIRKHLSNPYIKERLVNRLEWYMVSANRCEYFYGLASCVGIVMPTVILLVNSVPSDLLSDAMRQLFITALSGCSSVIGGLSASFAWHDNMLRYRASAEELKRETSLYMEKVGVYSDRHKRDGLFLNALEELSIRENRQWQKTESSHRGDNKEMKEEKK